MSGLLVTMEMVSPAAATSGTSYVRPGASGSDSASPDARAAVPTSSVVTRSMCVKMWSAAACRSPNALYAAARMAWTRGVSRPQSRARDASAKARFGQPEVNLGIIPGFGGTSRLARRVGLAHAKELVLTGAPIQAEEALRIGLANRVFPPEELLPRALAAGETIAQKGPLAVAAAKRVLQEGQDVDPRVAHALEQQAFGLVFSTHDRAEGMAAFLEKRDPVFEGR